MRISLRTLFQRLMTYPILTTIMPLYNLADNRRLVLDVFYWVRGLPHGYIKDGIRVALYNNLKVAFPYREDPAFDDVWLRDVYYLYKPGQDHVIIDIGAHMGFFTLKIARGVKRVIAVEPDPINFKFLKGNIRSNELEEKVLLDNSALGNENGQTFLDTRGYGFGRVATTTRKTDFSVTMKTLDRLVEELGLERLDAIKIDTEGDELKILQGAEGTLRRYKPDLFIAAYHFKREHILLAEQLKSLGYIAFCYDVPLFLSKGTETYIHARAQA